MKPITYHDVDHWFTYHRPSVDQLDLYEEIRLAGRHLATIIVAATPPGADQSAAIRKVREAVMTANAAIACHRLDPDAEPQA